jgi:hypothetical protein
MSCRLLWPSCVLTFLACIAPASAKGVDIWSDCACIPFIYWSAAPNPGVPTKPQPAKAKLAQPTAAPPSSVLPSIAQEKKVENRPAVAEIPKPEATGQHGPAVQELGPFYDSYAVALKGDQKPANDECTVTFTNLSDRPIKLAMDNQERALAKGESVKLPVKRDFTWKMEGREPQREQIGMGDFALLIVIRR